MTTGKLRGSMTKDKALTGAAGEYYVAFRLAAEGCAVGLTAHGTRAIDIVVANPNTGSSITIQSKTMRNALGRSGTESWWKWRVGTSRRLSHENFFYAFVNLRDDPSETPDVFIVPSGQLESLLEEYKDKEGRVIDSWCVIYEKDVEKYRNRWDIVKDALASTAAMSG